MKLNPSALVARLALLASLTSQLQAQGTAFTYQGRLNFNGTPAAGIYDFRFHIAADAGGSNFVGGAFLTNGVGVTNGLFLATPDFGPGIFNGSNLWLQIEVKTNGAASYVTLSPLQPVTPAPCAVFANTAGSVSGTVSAAQIGGGTIANAVLPASPIFSGTASASSFVGNGASVSNVNAMALNGLNSSNFWQLGGNNVSPGQFLGSTNFQAVELYAGGVRALRIEPDSRGLNAGSLIGGYPSNRVESPGSGGNVIAGGGFAGGFNIVHTNSSGNFIGAGSANQAGPNINDAVIAGGYANIIQSGQAAIGGGSGNSIQMNSPLSTIAGGQGNTIQPNVAQGFIGGGNLNTIQDSGAGAVIGGGTANVIHTNASGAVIGGGYGNEISAYNSQIGGGVLNVILPGAYDAFIGGGYQNSLQSFYSTIGGGVQNLIGSGATYSTVSGGAGNIIATNSVAGTIGGGTGNNVAGSFSTVPGGFFNFASGDYSFAAGTYARAVHAGAFVLSDSTHASYFSSTTNDQFSGRFGGGVRFVTAGAGLTLDGAPVLVSSGPGDGSGLTGLNPANLGGGTANININGNAATATTATNFLGNIADAQLTPNIARLNGAGSFSNTNIFAGMVIMTNVHNTLSGTFTGNGGNLTNLNPASLGAGTAGINITGNAATATSATSFTGNVTDPQLPASIARLNGTNIFTGTNTFSGVCLATNANNNFKGAFTGDGNGLNNLNATQLTTGLVPTNVLAGFQAPYYANIGGGQGNTANNTYAVVGGGFGNNASYQAAVGGGANNNASGFYSTVPGGNNNQAGGQYSFAAGQQAQATNTGTFVWADASSAIPFSSTATNQFLIRANGGVGINTNNPGGAALNVNGNITSPRWGVTNIINIVGPLSRTGTFTSNGGTLVIFASGSGYSAINNINVGMDVRLDGIFIDMCSAFAGTGGTHVAFVPKSIVKTGVSAGTHTITLTNRSGVTTDASDNFCVTVQELPF